MIGHRHIAGGVLLTLAVLGVLLWSQALGPYVAINDAQLNLPQHVHIVDVGIPKLSSGQSQATVGVLVRVENPSAFPIIVFRITYDLYMDNLTDTRSFWEKRHDIHVGVGGFHLNRGGFEVPAGSIRHIWANLTIDGKGQASSLEKLNTSFNGKYYPIVLATLQYRFPGTDMIENVLGLAFSTPLGVVPYDE